MSNFCPEWIYGVCCAKTAFDFLSTNDTLISISKKFSFGLTEKYDEIRYEEIESSAQKQLEFLSEINANDKATEFINDYIHHRCFFNSNGSERKLIGMFSSAFDGKKIKEYNVEKTFKVFKATIFSVRNGVIDGCPPGWVITDLPEIGWLGELFDKKIELF